jgi:hypothetical protein
MLCTLRVAALAALVLAAPGCAGKSPLHPAAADAAQALMAAAWSGDVQGFEARIDRPAVRADLRRQLQAVAQANHLAVEGGASDAALDRMITPEAFHLVAAESGQPLAAAPTRAQADALVKPAGKDRACVQGAAPEQSCLLTFAREKDGWRLVAMAPAGFVIPVATEPAKKSS